MILTGEEKDLKASVASGVDATRTQTRTSFFNSHLFSSFQSSSSNITAQTVPNYLNRLRLLEKSQKFQGKDPLQEEERRRDYESKMDWIKDREKRALMQKEKAISDKIEYKENFGELETEKQYKIYVKTMKFVYFKVNCLENGSPLILSICFDKSSQLNPKFNFIVYVSFT